MDHLVVIRPEGRPSAPEWWATSHAGRFAVIHVEQVERASRDSFPSCSAERDPIDETPGRFRSSDSVRSGRSDAPLPQRAPNVALQLRSISSGPRIRRCSWASPVVIRANAPQSIEPPNALGVRSPHTAWRGRLPRRTPTNTALLRKSQASSTTRRSSIRCSCDGDGSLTRSDSPVPRLSNSDDASDFDDSSSIAAFRVLGVFETSPASARSSRSR